MSFTIPKSLTANLIDLNSPILKNHLIEPLITESPKLVFPLPSTRESLSDNNPFDKVFKEAIKYEKDMEDPFEIVCEKAAQYDIQIQVTNSENQNEVFEKLKDPDEDADSSLGILDDSMISNDSLNTSDKHIQSTPNSLKITSILDASTEQEIRETIAERVNRCIEQASPSHRKNVSLSNLSSKRSCSNSYLGISNRFSSVSGGDTCSSLNRAGFLSTASTFEEFNSDQRLENDFDTAFHQHLQRQPSYNHQDSSTCVGPLDGRKSLSARKPTKYELASLERCRLMNYSSNIFNFKERLKLMDNIETEDDLKSKEDSNDSLYLENRKLVDTFSKHNEGSFNLHINGRSSPCESIKEEVITDLKFDCDKNNMLNEIDKNESPETNINNNKVNRPHNISKKLNQSKKWKKNAIQALETILQALKVDSDNEDINHEDLFTNVAKIIKNGTPEPNGMKQDENLDSTASCDSSDDFIEIKPQQIQQEQQQQQQHPKMRKSYSFTNGQQKKFQMESKNVIKTQKIETQQSLKNLRPKYSSTDLGKKAGPLKAVIPIDIMTKDGTVKTTKSSGGNHISTNGGNIKSTKMISSTPKPETKIKPVAQSTPTNTNTHTKSRKSVGISPISRYSQSNKKKNDGVGDSSLNSTFSPPPPISNDSTTKSTRKLISMHSSSTLTKMNQRTPSQNMLIRHKSASEIKVTTSSLNKKVVEKVVNAKNKMTALRPVNNLVTKVHRLSSVPGKENIRS